MSEWHTCVECGDQERVDYRLWQCRRGCGAWLCLKDLWVHECTHDRHRTTEEDE